MSRRSVDVSDDLLLDVQDLKVEFPTLRGTIHALQGVTFQLRRRETLGLAGETGCGKSVTALAILRLISPPGRISQGKIAFEGRDLLRISEAEMRDLRGSQISMILQEPKMALNPVIRVGQQVAETLLIHDRTLSRRTARDRAVEMLARLGIPDPQRIARRYPHELSGGMAQRVMIAMMLLTRPKLLIADEPTSALDVTIQAQILELVKALKREINTAVLLITHDLGIMAETCDRVAVMYAGSVVEQGPVKSVLKRPQHPYTQGLLKTIPNDMAPDQPLYSIRGQVPSLLAPPVGCAFAPRCERAMPECAGQVPPQYRLEADHHAACFLHAAGRAESGEPRAERGNGG
ncbi:MAG TPA: ABC transporter ATP-binding protein [Candidatus Acidoferrum sp.]|nr:ABC transporter ATP-binding protein [Candidatus Acidoferrum sp.]